MFHTKHSQYFGRTQPRSSRTVHMFDALDFLAELTQHVPPKRTQLIRRYGLYSSRIRGRWEKMPYVADRAPADSRQIRDAESDFDALGSTPMSEIEEVEPRARKRAWARLIAGPLLWAVY